MSKELIIGRTITSAVAVPADRLNVNGTHAKITVKDNGEWELVDLNSANGTYVKDSDGNFKRVYKKVIGEDSVIRLGQEGHESFIFMAHRAVSNDDSYSYEFRKLKKLLKNQITEEEAMETRNARNMTIVKAASPIAMGLCVVAQYAIPSLREDPSLNLWISRGAMALAPFAIGMVFGIDTKAVKALKQKRLKLLTCPKCGYPISEFDIHNMQCSRCKAK